MVVKKLLVVGAGGDVGQGIAAAAVERGWRVAAAGRDGTRLNRVAARHGDAVIPVTGSVADDAAAGALWAAAEAALGGIDATVVAVNAPNRSGRLLDWDARDLLGVLDANLITHFTAARTFVPRLAPNGVYVGIGGGTADFIPPGGGQLSMVQAALRMMYRAIAKETAGQGPHVREMMIVSMVNGASRRDVATPQWLTDMEVGRHVCAIIDDPARFPGPIEALRSREQIGQPEHPGTAHPAGAAASP